MNKMADKEGNRMYVAGCSRNSLAQPRGKFKFLPVSGVAVHRPWETYLTKASSLQACITCHHCWCFTSSHILWSTASCQAFTQKPLSTPDDCSSGSPQTGNTAKRWHQVAQSTWREAFKSVSTPGYSYSVFRINEGSKFSTDASALHLHLGHKSILLAQESQEWKGPALF